MRAKRHWQGGEAGQAAPLVIEPTAVYTAPQARQALGLKLTTLRREIALGRLRVSRRAGRYYLLGEWILDWLRGGEQRPSRRRAGGVRHREEPPTEGG
jgi:hypothetical protein